MLQVLVVYAVKCKVLCFALRGSRRYRMVFGIRLILARSWTCWYVPLAVLV
jgi:hypothetical protein